MGINVRLREERERLGYSQEAFGVLGGVRKQAQHMYESGARRPDANYLQALAEAGADVLYILTDQRSQAVAEVDLLPSDERVLIDAYRSCTGQAKKTLVQTAALLSAGMEAMPTQQSRAGHSVNVGGSVGVGAVVVAATKVGGIARARKK
jgi:transcriptional regulator with XRE-family HTH domain